MVAVFRPVVADWRRARGHQPDKAQSAPWWCWSIDARRGMWWRLSRAILVTAQSRRVRVAIRAGNS